MDLLAHRINRDTNPIVGKSNNSEAAPRQFFAARNIAGTFFVLLSINLDDKAGVEAYEIDDEAADRMLATKSQTRELAVAQTPPKQPLSINRTRSHCACGRAEEG